jgi:replicative DNA helicase
LDEIEEELNGKSDLSPTYVTQWPKFNELIGFENGDVIDIVAGAKVGKTTLGLNLIDHMVSTYSEDGLVVCLEMTQKRLAKKWISLVTGYEDTLCVPGSPEAKAKLEELKLAVVKAKEIQRMRSADLYFAYPTLVKDPEDIYKLIRDCIRRYGVKWVMVDNLQLLCDTIIGGRQGHRTVILSQISKALTRIAKDYGVKMIRIVQPKQLEKGAVIESRDVDGSSQIEKDCDGQVLLWRRLVGTKTQSQYEEEADEAEESKEVFDSLMRVTVPLSRYSSGGKCWMVYDGARSLVKSFVKDKHTALQQNFNGLIPQEQPQQNIEVPMEKI